MPFDSAGSNVGNPAIDFNEGIYRPLLTIENAPQRLIERNVYSIPPGHAKSKKAKTGSGGIAGIFADITTSKVR